MTSFLSAFITTTLAGLSTGIGGIVSIISKSNNKNILCFCLGLSAGAMICLSIIEILPESLIYLCKTLTYNTAFILIVLGFTIGTLIIIATNKILNKENSLYKTGIVTMIAVAIHNLPEGIIIFMTSANNLSLGITIAIGIAIHNIPEGIAIATPIYHSTRNRLKAFYLSLSSGLMEMCGGILCYLILSPFINNVTIGFMLSVVAGIMVYISLYNLIPEAKKYGNKYIYGLIFGVLIMWITEAIIK
jgi:ZIP family zinc transporter